MLYDLVANNVQGEYHVLRSRRVTLSVIVTKSVSTRQKVSLVVVLVVPQKYY